MRLRDRSIIKTTPREDAVLFDSKNIKDRYPVRPTKNKKAGGLPYYSYYSGYSPKGNCLDSRGESESIAHNLFQDVFLNLTNFKIKDGANEVRVVVDSVTVDYKVNVNEKNFYIIDVMYDLLKTFPYSHYYKWNGKIGLEIVVTTRVEKEKVDFLSSKSIQICSFKVPNIFIDELNPYVSKQDSKIMTENEYNKFLRKYIYLYSTEKFAAFSMLLGNVITKNSWKEKYHQMKLYEEQEQEMKNRINTLKKELTVLHEQKDEMNQSIILLEQAKKAYDIHFKQKKAELESVDVLNNKISDLNRKIVHEQNQTKKIKSERDQIKEHPIKFFLTSLKDKVFKN